MFERGPDVERTSSHLNGRAGSRRPTHGARSAEWVEMTGLASALGLGGRELVAFVGGGGKSSAMRLLTQELSLAGRVVTTTTTGMLRSELAAIGTVILNEDPQALAAELRATLVESPVAGAGLHPGTGDKIVGLPCAWADRLWADAIAPYLLVEADGSRRLPLKAFGPEEPQVPAETTTIVQIAGLDAIGTPLTEEHVHRAEILADGLGLPVGSTVTREVFVDCLLYQLQLLRERWPLARIVTLLNKAEGPQEEAEAHQVAEWLLAGLVRRPGAKAAAATRGAKPAVAGPDVILVGSVERGRFSCLRPPASVCAVVLAAGCATRMGRQKVLLPLQGRTLVEWVVDAALRSKVEQTVVVVGHEAERVRHALEGRAASVVVNPGYQAGMSSSVKAGIAAVSQLCDAAVFLLGDQPFVDAALINRVIDRFAETKQWIVRPCSGDRALHPVLMSRRLFPELLFQQGDVGGREIAALHPEHTCSVLAGDLAPETDIDTREDYEAARRAGGEPVLPGTGTR